MSPSEYKDWMQRAFLGVEGALATELLTATRLCVTEEYLRTAMVRALISAEPSEARRVKTEKDAAWSGNLCWKGTGDKPKQGRTIQHDIHIEPVSNDAGLLCEVKWLKGKARRDIIKDIWKLALSRGTTSERSATRTFLLIGGEADPFRETLKELGDIGIRLQWSRSNGQLPRATGLSLNAVLGHTAGSTALADVLKWGVTPTYRTPPACRRNLYIYTRGTWLRPRDVKIYADASRTTTVRWNLALWELNAEGTGQVKVIDWSAKRKLVAP